jgi:uncharacterized membrane protein
MRPNASLPTSTIYTAATAAEDTYSAKRSELFSEIRTVKQFWLIGDLIACTRVDEPSNTAYVAIRGTREVGNWIFTNFQAFFTRLYVVDDSINCSGSTFQGGKLRAPIDGTMHQGFIRAFSWLWYGTEPVFGQREFRREAALTQLIKYTIVFFGPITAWLGLNCFFPSFGTLTQALLVSLLVAFVTVCLENGVVEDFFLKTDPPTGKQLSLLISEFNKYDKVIFTGHSLGGAIASVAFAIYRIWCKSDNSRRDNGHLVTFGSARLGDEQFVNSFEEQHASRILHIQHPGDPVPQIPPNGLFELLALRFPLRGLGGFLLSLAFIPWTAYRYVWRVPRPARWSPIVVDHMNERPFRRICINFHSMSAYRKYTGRLLNEVSKKIDA